MPSNSFESSKSSAREAISLPVERNALLRGLIEECDPKRVLPQDRGSCMDEQLFLLSVLRTPGRPVAEIIGILRKKLDAPRISGARRDQIAGHIDQLSLLAGRGTPDPDAIPGVAHPALPLGTVEESLRGTPKMPKMVRVDLESLPESPFVDPKAFEDDEDSPTSPTNRRAVASTARTLSPVTIQMPDIAAPVVNNVESIASIAEEDLEEVEEAGNVGAGALAVNTPFSTVPVFGQAGDSITGLELPTLSAEQLAEQRRMEEEGKAISREREIVVLRDGFTLARAQAERWVSDESRLFNFEEVLESTLDAVLEAHVDLEAGYQFSAELIRGSLTDSLANAYFVALDHAGDDSLGFRELFKSYVNLRARLGALLRAEQRMRSVSVEKDVDAIAKRRMALSEARDVLGVFDDATRDDVEKAYILRLQALDLGEAADDGVIANLMRARETLLAHIERQEDQEAQEVEVVDNRGTRTHEQHPELSPLVEEPLEIAETDLIPIPSQHRTDRWYVEALRKPGNILRKLFFGGAVAAGVGAGGVALHEFSEVTTDSMHDVGHDYSLGVISGPFDGVGDLSGLIPKVEASVQGTIEVPEEEVRPVVHGSSVWGETVGMLRERGLKPTKALTSYFEHRIEEVNKSAIEAAGGVNHLPDNFPLIVTPIAEEMNTMAGIVPAASEPSIAKKTALESSSSVSASSSIERASVAAHERVVPTIDSPMRVMAKGEYLGKVTHSMLRAGGLNWTTARINQLNDLVWQQNLPLFEQLVREGKMRKLKPEYIPIGVELNFSSAAQEVQRLVAAKKPAKKGK